jgi:hypothetical protein
MIKKDMHKKMTKKNLKKIKNIIKGYKKNNAY